MGKYNKTDLFVAPKLLQHPADKAAAAAVRASPSFSKALSFISEHTVEKSINGAYRSTYAEVTPEISPVIWEMTDEAMHMFGVKVRPSFFLVRQYEMKAKLLGIREPVCLLSTEWLRQLDETGLWGLIASQVSAVERGYGEISMVEEICSTASFLLPDVFSGPLKMLLRNWHRYAQYSEDRCVLLATGDFNKTMAQHVLVGQAPASVLNAMDFTDPDCAYMKQSLEFAKEEAFLMKKARDLKVLKSGGAYATSRYLELHRFYSSEYYELLDELR